MLTFHYQAVLWLPPWPCRSPELSVLMHVGISANTTTCFSFYLLPISLAFPIHLSKQWVSCWFVFFFFPASFLGKCSYWTPDYVDHFYSHYLSGARFSTALYIFPLSRTSRPRALFFIISEVVYFVFESGCVVWIFLLIIKILSVLLYILSSAKLFWCE